VYNRAKAAVVRGSVYDRALALPPPKPLKKKACTPVPVRHAHSHTFFTLLLHFAIPLGDRLPHTFSHATMVRAQAGMPPTSSSSSSTAASASVPPSPPESPSASPLAAEQQVQATAQTPSPVSGRFMRTERFMRTSSGGGKSGPSGGFPLTVSSLGTSTTSKQEEAETPHDPNGKPARRPRRLSSINEKFLGSVVASLRQMVSEIWDQTAQELAVIVPNKKVPHHNCGRLEPRAIVKGAASRLRARSKTPIESP